MGSWLVYGHCPKSFTTQTLPNSFGTGGISHFADKKREAQGNLVSSRQEKGSLGSEGGLYLPMRGLSIPRGAWAHTTQEAPKPKPTPTDEPTPLTFGWVFQGPV